jgi:nucleoside-diphosphate-sugar epimerase
MSKLPNVSILGTGWLGFPLALSLKELGYQIKGSSRSNDKLKRLKENGIPAFSLSVENESENWLEFFNCDQLIINIPFKKVEPFERLMERVAKTAINRIIFVSSTSVYSECHGEVREDSNQEDPNHPLTQIENLIKQHDNVSIVRFGGLIGWGRHPARFFERSGKKVPNALMPVNLIHGEDAVSILSKLVSMPSIKGDFNAVAPSHPSKFNFYQSAGNSLAIELQFEHSMPENVKIVQSDKVKQALDFNFKYPELMALPFKELAVPYASLS